LPIESTCTKLGLSLKSIRRHTHSSIGILLDIYPKIKYYLEVTFPVKIKPIALSVSDQKDLIIRIVYTHTCMSEFRPVTLYKSREIYLTM
jgi:hypothetical protein